MFKNKLYIHGVNSKDSNLGAWSVILVDEFSGSQQGFSGSAANTTATRMKLTALLRGLKALQERRNCIQIYSDSFYIINALQKDKVKIWKANGWKKENGFPVPDADLWTDILKEIDRLDTRIKYICLQQEQGEDGVVLQSDEPMMFMCNALISDEQHKQKSASGSGKAGEQYIVTMRVSAPEDVTIGDIESCLHGPADIHHIETIGVTRILGNATDPIYQEHALVAHSKNISKYASKGVL